MRYAVKLTQEEDGSFSVTVPDLPDAMTFGEDREDALARALDAIESALMGRMAAREEIELPKTNGTNLVVLPALSAAKVALYTAMRRQKVGKAALAKRLQVALPQIDRLLDLRHRSRLDMMERAFEALGHVLEIAIRPAP